MAGSVLERYLDLKGALEEKKAPSGVGAYGGKSPIMVSIKRFHTPNPSWVEFKDAIIKMQQFIDYSPQ